MLMKRLSIYIVGSHPCMILHVCIFFGVSEFIFNSFYCCPIYDLIIPFVLILVVFPYRSVRRALYRWCNAGCDPCGADLKHCLRSRIRWVMAIGIGSTSSSSASLEVSDAIASISIFMQVTEKTPNTAMWRPTGRRKTGSQSNLLCQSLERR